MAHAGVRVRRHNGCLRGLHYLYTVATPVDPSALANDLERHLPGQLVRSEERWGPQLAQRLILQFRFEVRIVEGQTDIALLHRACTAEDIRERDRHWLLCALARHLETTTQAAHQENIQ